MAMVDGLEWLSLGMPLTLHWLWHLCCAPFQAGCCWSIEEFIFWLSLWFGCGSCSAFWWSCSSYQRRVDNFGISKAMDGLVVDDAKRSKPVVDDTWAWQARLWWSPCWPLPGWWATQRKCHCCRLDSHDTIFGVCIDQVSWINPLLLVVVFQWWLQLWQPTSCWILSAVHCVHSITPAINWSPSCFGVSIWTDTSQSKNDSLLPN